MKNRELNYTEIERLFQLMNYTDGTTKVKVADMAKEGGWKRTDLTEFLIENKGHFNVGQFVDKKNGLIVKQLGLFITQCYENVVDNPETDEWLDVRTENNKDRFFFRDLLENYGCSHYYNFIIDEGREGDWRNTAEKYERLKKLGNFKSEGDGSIIYTPEQFEELKNTGIDISFGEYL